MMNWMVVLRLHMVIDDSPQALALRIIMISIKLLPPYQQAQYTVHQVGVDSQHLGIDDLPR